MAKAQGSVGEHEEAVAIAYLAVAGKAEDIVAGSAVAGAAVPDVVWYKDADSEDDGFGSGPLFSGAQILGGASWTPPPT